DSIRNDLIFLLDCESGNENKIQHEKGEYTGFSIDQEGNRVAFIADRDTTEAHARPLELFYWSESDNETKVLVNRDSEMITEGWQLSSEYTPIFSEDNRRIFFGIAPVPFEEDSTILEEEKVEVEIWNYKDGLLYTQQESRLSREKKRSYPVAYSEETKKFAVLGDQNTPEVMLSPKTKGDLTISYTELPYQQYISSLGYAFKDVFITNLNTGNKKQIGTKIHGSPRMSPGHQYAYWYSRPDTSWMCYHVNDHLTKRVTTNGFYDELNDRPMDPRSSGMLGWTSDDKYLLVYDQYDLWKVDPVGIQEPINLTRGRQSKLRYRHIRLDREIEHYPGDTTILLKVFDEKDKSSGYVFLNLETHFMRPLSKGPYSYTTNITKAKNSDEIIYTRASFKEFPDLILSDTKFSSSKKISNANPQQADYGWGSIELINWQNSKGEKVEGLLVKPPGFDPSKKYPLIVNFYERNSQGLHRHRAPYPHRSTINYAYYSNRGYVIFNPDIKYDIGYPGKSCYEAVMTGVDAVLEMGVVDKSRMALQGHSWGGYQIAHLLTKTNRFKCAEAGAPVVNMVSAYGGIRWRTGMSRMFQYEKTQSRLGATLWERPDLYLENSPIFNIDKVETPVLILHNDKDGAVPWYQGIEYFVALRRLGKPAWLLNYNDEPHWPVKRHNRLDFNKRLSQFFDHFLMDAPLPEWMDKGIPVIEKGFNDGMKTGK
ncbi:MAG: prolyl oligopeptidase family serine peptidase, partial [Bacteroidia bacterium]|nr:prolyl oligopeptidase family serine peptidase [Bacteroidia bacterium]